MSSYNLPTVDQISAYHAGKMPLKERRILEARMKKNPFVREVVMLTPATDMKAVQRISGKVSRATHHDYFSKTGFWSRPGSWISFVGVAVIIGAGVFFQDDILQLIKGEESIGLVEQTIPSSNTIEAVIEVEEKSEKMISNLQNSRQSNDPSLEYLKDESNEVVVAVLDDPTVEFNVVQPVTQNSDQPAVVATNLSKDKMTMTVLGVKSVSILSKSSPDAKTSAPAETDFPSYVKGDQALKDDLKKSVKSIQVADAENYDRKAKVTFVVSAKGRISETSVTGNIHPTLKGQLMDAINALPKFNGGKVKVKYVMEIKF